MEEKEKTTKKNEREHTTKKNTRTISKIIYFSFETYETKLFHTYSRASSHNDELFFVFFRQFICFIQNRDRKMENILFIYEMMTGYLEKNFNILVFLGCCLFLFTPFAVYVCIQNRLWLVLAE